MKKNLTCFIIATLLGGMLTGIAPAVKAQVPDTVVVEPGTPGAVEQAVTANPAMVIKLRRGGVYIIQETIAADTGIVIYGEASPTATAPATLVRSADEGGPPLIDTNNDLKLENIALLGETLQGSLMNTTVRLRNKDGADYEFYNCYWERSSGRLMRFDAPNPRIIAKDNIFLYVGSITSWQGGFVFNTMGAMPREAVIQNNTALTCGSVFITNFREELNGNFTIDHNTFILGNREYFTPNDNYVNVLMKNNIFLNPFSRGYSGLRVNAEGDTTYFGDFVDAETDEPGDTLQAFLTFDSLAEDYLTRLGITEDERNVLFTQNCLFREQHIYDWYEEKHYTEQPFMTDRSQAFVAANPGITIDDPMNVDPQFVKQLPDSVYIKYKDWINYNRLAEAFKPPGGPPDRYWYTDDNPDLPFAWPVRPSDGPDAVLDLSYSSGNQLYTAAEKGYPLGDLNWFPELKEKWEQGIDLTAIEDDGGNIATTFQVHQNYPNPFNPTTTIAYTLEKNQHITLAIYNVLGQKVKTLVDQKQKSGVHEVVWNGTNDVGKKVVSGVYFYRILTENKSVTKKMALLK